MTAIAVGDVVSIFSPQAGYPKYHLCVLEASEDAAACFLFMNSNDGYPGGFVGDFVMPDTAFPFLPPSPTGQSVISCSTVVRFNVRQLELFKADVKGKISPEAAAELLSFVKTVRTLIPREKKMVIASLELLCPP